MQLATESLVRLSQLDKDPFDFLKGHWRGADLGLTFLGTDEGAA